MNTCSKIHLHPSTKDRGIVSREIGVNGQRTDGRTTDGQPASIMPLIAYCCPRRYWKAGGTHYE